MTETLEPLPPVIPPPRRVKLSGAGWIGRICALILTCFSVVAGTLLFSLGGMTFPAIMSLILWPLLLGHIEISIRRERALLQDGIAVYGAIRTVSLYGRSYYLRFDYEADGKQYRGKGWLSEAMRPIPEVGGQIPILYRPDRPSVAIPLNGSSLVQFSEPYRTDLIQNDNSTESARSSVSDDNAHAYLRAFPLPPRKVITGSSSVCMRGCLAVLILCFGLVFSQGYSYRQRLSELQTRGKTTTAMVINKRISYTKSNESCYNMTARFIANGRPIDIDFTITQNWYRRARIGNTFRVTYLPSNPQTYELEYIVKAPQQSNNVFTVGDQFLQLYIILGFGFLIGCTERFLRSRMALLRNGVATVGIISSVGSTKDGTPFIDYQYDVDGKRYLGGGAVSRTHLESPEIGQSMVVVYHPTRPNKSMPAYDSTFVRLA